MQEVLCTCSPACSRQTVTSPGLPTALLCSLSLPRSLPLHPVQKVTFNSLCATDKSPGALADRVSRWLAWCFASTRFSSIQEGFSFGGKLAQLHIGEITPLPCPAARHNAAHRAAHGGFNCKAESIGSNQANCFTLHNPHNQDISQMTFSFVVMHGPFCFECSRGARGRGRGGGFVVNGS